MQVQHPLAGDGDGVPPAAVDVNGEHVAVDEDGVFEVDDEAWLRRFAERHDVDPDDLVYEEDGPPDDGGEGEDDGDEITVDEVEALADEVIAERIDAGECPWCDDYEGDAVGQHASAAHPDAWDDYKENS